MPTQGASSPIAVIADIHGNSWALEAVLADIDRRRIPLTINLGDSVYGPLDPGGTADRLIQRGTINVRGNQDRVLVEVPEPVRTTPTFEFVMRQLTSAHLKWLQGHVPTYVHDDVFCCHGDPLSDETCLAEQVLPEGVRLANSDLIASRVARVPQAVILCAHTHLPRLVRLPSGQFIMNPGSVGIPAFSETSPFPHVFEAGSPHARYAILSHRADAYDIDHVALFYPWHLAAKAARQNRRDDWAGWIETGRAT